MTTTAPARHYRKATAPEAKLKLKTRIVGIDALRGFGLIGMFAVHSLLIFNEDGSPTFVTQVAAGRSAAAFALLAGISLALMSGGNARAGGQRLKAISAGLVGRAIVIGVIGCLVGYAAIAHNVQLSVILVYYALAFLLAIPLLRFGPKALFAIAATISLVSPVVIHLLRPNLLNTDSEQPIFSDFYLHPLQAFSELLVTGPYPVLALMTYLAAGIAIGRLDLRSTAVATRLVVIGVLLAVVAWLASSILLFRFEGLQQLFEVTTTQLNSPTTPSTVLWWAQVDSATWWELVQRAPHSYTTFDLAHTVGVSMALLGVLLLITRAALVRTVLKPVAAAGSMSLTIYTLQVFMLAGWKFELSPYHLFFYGMVAVTLVFATVWQAVFGQGPLERIASMVSKAFRRAADNRLAAGSEPDG